MSNTFDKLSVLDSFIEEVNSYLPEIETNFERLAQLPGDMEALEETYRRTHTIGGSASMMDFPGLAHVAHGMEDILGDALDGLTALDVPTLGLLQRSLKRLYLLVGGIRGGVDQEAVIAEDDADYVEYRTMMDAAAQHTSNNGVSSITTQSQNDSEPLVAEPFFSSSLPSLDEVLASFRTPVVSEDEDVAWPEEPVYDAAPVDEERETSEFAKSTVTSSESDYEPEHVNPTALEMLATSAGTQFSQDMPPVTPMPDVAVEEEGVGVFEDLQEVHQEEDYPRSLPVVQSHGEEAHSSEVLSTTIFAQAYNDMQAETHSLEVQASSLKEMLNQLRMAMGIIEMQRTEFKGFLDGSKDALDRMEDWAGQAMGLNLRNSPEQVRRYLPLSVMWVSNAKLKKILDLLRQITSGAEMSDEQMRVVLQQLSASIVSCGEAFRHLQVEATSVAVAPPKHILTQEVGWTPWEMEVSHKEDALRERVTFERRGDREALRAEVEAEVREELRQEYEATLREEMRREFETRPLTLAARSELEQQVRSEIRQEFEAKRQLQESVSGQDLSETLAELEAQLRSEIEIQVRQEFLSQITVEGADSFNASMQQTLLPPAPTAPRTSNFVDKARQAAGLLPLDQGSSVEPQQIVATPVVATPMPLQQPATPKTPIASIGSAPQQVQESPMSSFGMDFSEEASEIFRLEAEEHLQTIIMHVAALEKTPEDRELIQGIRRATHTLKGAAAMMGFRAIADLSHIFEDLLDSIMEGSTVITATVTSLVLDTAELLDMLITGKEDDAKEEEAKVQRIRPRYAELLGEQSIILSGSVDEDIDADEVSEESFMGDAQVAGVVAGSQPTETHAQRAARGDLSVRVRLQKLDELVNLFGEMLVNRSILEERITRLMQLVADAGISSNRLRDVGQKLESRFEAATLPSGRSVQVMPGQGNQGMGSSFGGNGRKGHTQPAHLEEFDELELDRYTEFHQLARGLSEGISDMTTLSTEMEAVIRECEGVFARENRLNTTFQDRLMKARLVPLSTMTPRLYRAARAVALKQHKEFTFLLEGEETEVDRTVNEEIAGPLLHLMRNAVNHAIETPEVRLEKGKPAAGEIRLSAAYEGNQVVITVRDDGAGIDPVRVRNTAIANGIITSDQLLSDSDIIALIFRPGFSTAEVLSEESGRGVGLDVVRDSVSRLRGTLEVESTPGQGTAFTMKFPTSLAIQSAMLVKVGEQQFAIPTVMVEAIGRLDNYKRSTQSGRPAIIVQNDVYPLNMLSQLLSLPVGLIDDKAPLLLINAGGNRVALLVDEIRGKLDVVMKNLGPHLRSVQGIAGGTVMGNGRVVLILELTELLATRSKLMGSAMSVPATTIRRESTAAVAPASQAGLTGLAASMATSQKISPMAKPPVAAPPAEPERGKHILIVDDSPSVRRVVGNMLKQHGWEVQMARDGVEALDAISQNTPAAVLLDIEMPRMDGYELIATVRAQEQYRTLPMVVLTSRAAAKHQQRAIQLGASSYVVKPYQDEELINTLNTLVYGAVTR